jgi:hypothetical protein
VVLVLIVGADSNENSTSSSDATSGFAVVQATATNAYQDLFFSVPGSYGSVAMLTCITIRLIPASTFVRLRYHRFSDLQTTIRFLETNQRHQESLSMEEAIQTAPIPQQQQEKRERFPLFVDGVCFAADHYVIITGDFCTNDDALTISSRYEPKLWDPFYYQHVAAHGTEEESMKTIDYLFRWDRGGRWVDV